jgi:adenylate kinase family enzyme
MTAKAHAVNINNIPPLIGKDGVFRVVIHGNSGSGKSTLASRLGSILNVPVIYLDKLHWRPNWVEAPDEELVAELRGIIEEGVRNNTGWIVDGNGEGRTKRIMDFAATDIICT